MENSIVGRKKEIMELKKYLSSEQSEFIAVYGRRRVGKTFLIKELLEGQFTFRMTGKENARLGEQLLNFSYAMSDFLGDDHVPQNWTEAFRMLSKNIERLGEGTKIIFIDELPWLDSPKSGFMRAFEGFWNNWGCHRKNLMLVVCGSASSWILDHLIQNHGGLYNRVTCEIKLSPFTLHESELFLKDADVHFSRYDLVQCYMIFGGIPFYLDALDGRLSLAQNVDQLFFKHNAQFRDEYDRLFASVFSNPEAVKAIVALLYTRRGGFTRKEISQFTGLSGGVLTSFLKALVGSDFVEKYIPFGFGARDAHYKLVDPFCLFYLHFIANLKKTDEQFWVHHTSTQDVVSWRGLAFENICFRHVPQIKRSLGISGVRSTQSAWVLRGEANNAQIDLLIERDDHVINACEIKFYSDEFTVNYSYYRELLSRQGILMEHISPKMSVYQTLISSYGLKRNEYSGIFTQVVTMDDLFSE